MRNIKLTLEYDGSEYYGFQRQPRHKTVQEELESALTKLFGQKLKIAAASGRTDSGVHAHEQVVNFKTKKPHKTSSIQNGLNRYLPSSIVIRKAQEVREDFHSRYHAKSKTYEYLVWNGEVRSPLLARYAYHVRGPLNVRKMRQGALVLKGRHDFKAFCASDPKRELKDSVRTIKRLQIQKEGNLIRFRVEANGFLYHMVRNLVGTLLEVGQGRRTPASLKVILTSRDRKKAGRTAPAKGLTLSRVTY